MRDNGKSVYLRDNEFSGQQISTYLNEGKVVRIRHQYSTETIEPEVRN